LGRRVVEERGEEGRGMEQEKEQAFIESPHGEVGRDDEE
jgi:hypothetical protein